LKGNMIALEHSIHNVVFTTMKKTVIGVDRIKQDYLVTWKFRNFYSPSPSAYHADALKIIVGLSQPRVGGAEKVRSQGAEQIWITQISQNDISRTRHRRDINLPTLAARSARKARLIFLPMRQE